LHLNLKETWLKKRTFEANNHKKVICEPNYSHFKSKACPVRGPRRASQHFQILATKAPTHVRDAFKKIYLKKI
jgi:hypothetical protein